MFLVFMEWKRKRLRFINKPPLFFSIFFFFFFFFFLFNTTVSSTMTCPDSKSCLLSAEAESTNSQDSEKTADKMMMTLSSEASEKVEPLMSSARRYLGGLGSSPPRCLWKCGSCTPCKPVHVPVPPGTPVTAEYYPEAWRCKCGNKLYMP